MMTFEDSGVQRGAPITARDIKWLHWLLTHIQSPNCDVEYTMQSGRPTLTITAPNIDIGQLQELLPDSYKVKGTSADGSPDYLDAKCRYSIRVDATSKTLELVGDVADETLMIACYGHTDTGAKAFIQFEQVEVVKDIGKDGDGNPIQRKITFYVPYVADVDDGDYTEPTEVVATPEFAPDGGSHVGSVDVTITCATAAAEIRYTVDGSAPTDASTLYTTPVTLTVDQTVLRARAYKAGLTLSNIKSATYTITAGGEFRWLACSDDSELVIYQAGQSHLPTHDYAWIDAGSGYVRAYLDDEVDDTPGSNPCSVEMASDPGSCGALDYSAFDDSFDDSSFDTCRHSLIQETGTSATEGGSGLACQGGTNSSYRSCGAQSRAPLVGDFRVDMSFTGLADYGTRGCVIVSVFDGTNEYHIFSGDLSGLLAGAYGIMSYAATESPQREQHSTSVATSGTLWIARAGTTMTIGQGATTHRTITVGTDPFVAYVSLQRQNQNASVTITGIAFS